MTTSFFASASASEPVGCQSYYQEIAPYLLPYLKGRPLSLLRSSNDAAFYLHQGKDLPKSLAEALALMPDDLITCPNEAVFDQLLSLQSADYCLGFFIWPSRLETQERPDWVSWKLVAGKQTSPSEFAELGQAFFALLEETGRPIFLKTLDTPSSLGLDFVMPSDGSLSYDEANLLASQKATELLQRYSGELKLLKTPDGDLVASAKFGIYTGANQWKRGILAPYSFNLKKSSGACSASIPLASNDLNENLGSLISEPFTMALMKERLDRYGDLWKNLL